MKINLFSILFLVTFLISFFLITPTQSTLLPEFAIRATLTTTNSIAQFLYAHNVVRARHRLPPLRWSSQLASYAKWYANQRKRDCAMIHSTGMYGENIFWGQGSKWKASDAVRAWAAQEPYFNYKGNSCLPGKDCWHYTQLVWRSSRELGCAKVKCYNGDTFVVCEYNPHGNTIGQRPY